MLVALGASPPTRKRRLSARRRPATGSMRTAEHTARALRPAASTATGWPACCRKACASCSTSRWRWSCKPKVLLLDEPTSGVSARREVRDHGHASWRRSRPRRVTVLFVEHDMDIVERYADRVLAFYEGRIIADGAPDACSHDDEVRRYVIGSITRRPRTREAAMLAHRDLDVSIGSVAQLRGVSLEVADGEDGRADRPQRRRQDHADAHASWASCRAQAGSITFRRRDRSTALPAHGRAPLGIGYMPEDRGLVPSSRSRRTSWCRRGPIGSPTPRSALAARLRDDSRGARVRAAQGDCSSPAVSRSWWRWRAR